MPTILYLAAVRPISVIDQENYPSAGLMSKPSRDLDLAQRSGLLSSGTGTPLDSEGRFGSRATQVRSDYTHTQNADQNQGLNVHTFLRMHFTLTQTLTGRLTDMDFEPDHKVGVCDILLVGQTDQAQQISQVKEALQEKEGIQATQIRLIFGGRQL